MGFLEEADVAYGECVNLGNYELNTFVQWADVLKEMQGTNTYTQPQ